MALHLHGELRAQVCAVAFDAGPGEGDVRERVPEEGQELGEDEEEDERASHIGRNHILAEEGDDQGADHRQEEEDGRDTPLVVKHPLALHAGAD